MTQHCRRLQLVALVAVVALLAGSCAIRQSTRHVAVAASTGLYAALAAVDDLERDLFAKGRLTALEHATLDALVVELLKTGRSINTVINEWPQENVSSPPELVPLVTKLKGLANQITALVSNSETRATLTGAIAVVNQIAVSVLQSFQEVPTQ